MAEHWLENFIISHFFTVFGADEFSPHSYTAFTEALKMLTITLDPNIAARSILWG